MGCVCCQSKVGGASAWAVCAVSHMWEGPVHGLCVLSVKCGRGQCMGCLCCQSKVGGASELCVLSVKCEWMQWAVSPCQMWVGPVHGLSVKCGWGLCDVFTVSVGRVYELFTVKSGWGLWTVFTVRCG